MLRLINSQFDLLKQRLACALDWAYRAALTAGTTNLALTIMNLHDGLRVAGELCLVPRPLRDASPERKKFLLQPVASRAICRPWSTGCNSLYVPGTTLSPTRRPLATSAPTGSVCAETR